MKDKKKKRKLGPSGKPIIHKKRHSSRKKAKEAARREGAMKPVNHKNPKRGRKHYHGTDKHGKKKAGSTHHEY